MNWDEERQRLQAELVLAAKAILAHTGAAAVEWSAEGLHITVTEEG